MTDTAPKEVTQIPAAVAAPADDAEGRNANGTTE
tara:strand:+ start:130 stop:231 length:102 start_codon:yes stop_codon:yes gene_type:complete